MSWTVSIARTLQKNIGLTDTDVLTEDQRKITMFDGEQDTYEFFFAVLPKKEQNGTLVWVVGFDTTDQGLKQIEGFDDWLKGKIETLNASLSRSGVMPLIEPKESHAFPPAVLEYTVKSHRGLLLRLQETGRRNIRRLAIVIPSVPALYILHSDYGVPTEGAIAAFLIIVAWQFGPAAYSLRRRLRH